MGINLAVGWIAILVGLLVGAGIGTFFHRRGTPAPKDVFFPSPVRGDSVPRGYVNA